MSALTIDANGWLVGAQQYVSPHYDERPLSAESRSTDPVDLLVLHNISLPPGQLGDKYVHALFMGELEKYQHEHPFLAQIANLRVSAHFYITRDGRIIQYVATTKSAWHAGVSAYQGRTRCNDFSIGIELNGADFLPYTQRQYQVLSLLCHAIMSRHPKVDHSRFTTHAHIAPTRKTDPGPAFNHHYFHRLLQIT